MENPHSSDFNPAESERLSQLLHEWAADLGVSLSMEQLKSFHLYYRELHFWNSRFNLVASTGSATEVFVKHFLDSLTLVSCFSTPEGRLLDIGTGGGFPGIPLKISLPGLKVTLLEASRKKVSFLKSLCRLLKLEEMSIVQQRVEDLLNDDRYHHRFDMVVSRAALKLPEYLQVGKELLSSSGFIFAMKGANYQQELDDVQSHLQEWNLFLADIHTLTLPHTGDFRAILIFKKL